jgi:lipopolysaccharide biosynthesis regulator YciM
MGVSQRAANEKVKKRMFNPNLKAGRESLPYNITTSEVICQKCGFKARYKFLRCPNCDDVQK